MQHAQRMRRTILSPVTCPALQYFSWTAKFSEKSHWTHSCVCFGFVYIFFWNISYSKKNAAKYYHKCTHRSSCKVSLCLSDLNETWILSKDFRNILKCQVSRTSVRWEPSCSTWTGRHTNTTKLIVAFRNSANTTQKVKTIKRLYNIQNSYMFQRRGELVRETRRNFMLYTTFSCFMYNCWLL